MAILQQPIVGGNVFADQIGDDLAPAGTFVATIIDIKDEFAVQRQKFQSQELETVDLTTFLFGFRDAQGCEHRVASRRFRISGNEKASLFGFLKSLLGHAPQYGWDYMELRGRQCLLTVEHVTRRDGTGVFAAIAALSPVPAGFGQPAPQAPAAQAAVPRPMAAPVQPGGVRPVARAPQAVRPIAPSPTVAPGGAMAGRPAPAVNDPIPF